MASLRKRNDKWQARVRRTGHNPRSKSFLTRTDALRWIRQTEQELDRVGLAYDPSVLERMTVADLLNRYLAEITPSKRGAASERKRLEVFLRAEWAKLTLAGLTPQTFTRFNLTIFGRNRTIRSSRLFSLGIAETPSHGRYRSNSKNRQTTLTDGRIAQISQFAQAHRPGSGARRRFPHCLWRETPSAPPGRVAPC